MTKTAVVDASFVLSYLFPDEPQEEVDMLFEQFTRGDITLIAPHLLPFEITNGIRSAIKRKRVTQVKARLLLENFAQLRLHYVAVDETAMLRCALRYKLSAYDAAYLTLAHEKHVPLYTMDVQLKTCTKKKSAS